MITRNVTIKWIQVKKFIKRRVARKMSILALMGSVLKSVATLQSLTEQS